MRPHNLLPFVDQKITLAETALTRIPQQWQQCCRRRKPIVATPIKQATPANNSTMVIDKNNNGTIFFSGELEKCDLSQIRFSLLSTTLSIPDCKNNMARNKTQADCKKAHQNTEQIPEK